MNMHVADIWFLRPCPRRLSPTIAWRERIYHYTTHLPHYLPCTTTPTYQPAALANCQPLFQTRSDCGRKNPHAPAWRGPTGHARRWLDFRQAGPANTCHQPAPHHAGSFNHAGLGMRGPRRHPCGT